MTIRELFDLQARVVRRGQLPALGATPNDIRRWLRQRRIVTVYPGVYVNHRPADVGQPSMGGRAGELARCAGVRVGSQPGRRPDPRGGQQRRDAGQPAGVDLHWLTDLDDRVLWTRSPPRVRFEDALLTAAGRACTRTETLALLADGCRRLDLDATAWHRCAVVWDAAAAKFYVDDQLVHSSPQGMDYPMQLMVDLFEFPESPERNPAAYPKHGWVSRSAAGAAHLPDEVQSVDPVRRVVRQRSA